MQKELAALVGANAGYIWQAIIFIKYHAPKNSILQTKSLSDAEIFT